MQGLWITQYMQGKHTLPSRDEMEQEISSWQERQNATPPEGLLAPFALLNSLGVTGWQHGIDLQSDYVRNIELFNDH